MVTINNGKHFADEVLWVAESFDLAFIDIGDRLIFLRIAKQNLMDVSEGQTLDIDDEPTTAATFAAVSGDIFAAPRCTICAP